MGGSGLGGTALGTGSGAIGSTDQTLGSTASSVTGTASGAASSVTGAASSTIDRAPPLNSVTNSLMGSVRNAVSTATNPALNPNALGRNGTGQNARGSGVPPAGERRFVPNEVVVGLASNMSPVALDELAQRHRLTAVESHDIALVGTTYYRWRITDGRSISDVIRALEADGVVRHAQPNYRFTLAQAPVPAPSARAELDSGAQYASAKLHLDEAHHFATGEKVLVAVIDSAIDTSHPEIIDAVADRFDAIAPVGAANPHGTGMAGAIVARAKLMGAAPNVRLLAIRAFNGEGDKSEATTLSLLTGIDWAVAHGARIINMSFAGPYDPDIARGVAAARQKGVVLVAAAGNAGPKSPPLYPAADKNVIAVTAIDADDRLLSAAEPRQAHRRRGTRRRRAGAGSGTRVPTDHRHLGRSRRGQRHRRASGRAQAFDHAGRGAQGVCSRPRSISARRDPTTSSAPASPMPNAPSWRSRPRPIAPSVRCCSPTAGPTCRCCSRRGIRARQDEVDRTAVIAGLVPATPITGGRPCHYDRGGRDKPGHDVSKNDVRSSARYAGRKLTARRRSPRGRRRRTPR